MNSATLRALTKSVSAASPPLHFSFLIVHYIYIIFWIIIASSIIYLFGDIAYINALLLSSGAATQSGLNPVDLNSLYTYQQIVLWLVAMVTNPIFVNSSLVFIRLYWFRKRFRHVIREAKTSRQHRDDQDSIADDSEGGVDTPGFSNSGSSNSGYGATAERQISAQRDANIRLQHRESSEMRQRQWTLPVGYISKERVVFDADGEGDDARSTAINLHENPSPHMDIWGDFRDEEEVEAQPLISSPAQKIAECPRPVVQGRHTGRVPETFIPSSQHVTFEDPMLPSPSQEDNDFPPSRTPFRYSLDELEDQRLSRQSSMDTSSRHHAVANLPTLLWQSTIASYSDWDETQKEQLGGVEYRALKTLSLILVGYFVFFHLFGILCFIPWIYSNQYYGDVVRNFGLSKAWWAIFTSCSAFNDLGFTLTPNSMMSFNGAAFPLLLMTFLIVVGNTAFPCMLRFVTWVLWKLSPRGSPLQEEVEFLLEHPRRCFTLLFPAADTWRLLAVLAILNFVDIFFFIALDVGTRPYSLSLWLVNGLFQVASTRTAGFMVTDLSRVHPAVQVSFVIMMYISAFPTTMAMRKTNVYEEKSLGIYTTEEVEEHHKERSHLGTHLQKQLGFDLWYIFAGMFLIALVEGHRLERQANGGFTLFGVLFETVSAYGTVGLSLGYPGAGTSLCAQFNTPSKLVVVAMQVRGRHRGLPYALDHAILLPHELNNHQLASAMEAEYIRRPSSTMSLGRSPAM